MYRLLLTCTAAVAVLTTASLIPNGFVRREERRERFEDRRERRERYEDRRERRERYEDRRRY